MLIMSEFGFHSNQLNTILATRAGCNHLIKLAYLTVLKGACDAGQCYAVKLFDS